MIDYPAGTVASVNHQGSARTVIKGLGWDWWGPGVGQRPVAETNLTSIRPLAVLDPEDWEAMRDLAQRMGYLNPGSPTGALTQAVQRALRSLAPPASRIDEPGWGAIVKAHTADIPDRLRWVRTGIYWTSEAGNCRRWNLLLNPEAQA